MNRWKCTTCNLSLHINNKNDHINGKRHRTNLVSSASNSWMCSVCGLAMSVTDKDSHIATHAATAQPTTSNRWTCDVCSSTMSIKDEVSHLAGAKHRSAAQAPTPPSLWTCSVCSLAMSVSSKDSHLATHAVTAHATNPRWTCTVCALTMAVNNKDSHLAGAKHRSAVRAADSSAPLPPGWWECETCNRAPMKAQNKDAHLKSKGHQSGGGPKTQHWNVCVSCGKAVPQDKMGAHNATHSSGARGRRREKSTVGGNTRSRLDEAYGDHGDAPSILRDVDTQRGILPGRGVYKESGIYYEPDYEPHYPPDYQVGLWDSYFDNFEYW